MLFLDTKAVLKNPAVLIHVEPASELEPIMNFHGNNQQGYPVGTFEALKEKDRHIYRLTWDLRSSWASKSPTILMIS